MNLLSLRQLFALGFVGCAGCMAFALYLQHFQGLDPCPLCVFQRVAMIATALVFLAGAVHAPRANGRWVYAGAAALTAAAGVGLAGRHVWLQSLPPDQVPACGPTLDYLMDMLPLREVFETVLKGDGECAKVKGEFLGISLPAWTLVAFVGSTLFALAAPVIARKEMSGKEIP
jgi:disulfide bond formation protein DsbB